jgi:hypothetical protein
MSKQYELMHLSLLQSIGSIVNLFSVYQKQIHGQVPYAYPSGAPEFTPPPPLVVFKFGFYIDQKFNMTITIEHNSVYNLKYL